LIVKLYRSNCSVQVSFSFAAYAAAVPVIPAGDATEGAIMVNHSQLPRTAKPHRLASLVAVSLLSIFSIHAAPAVADRDDADDRNAKIQWVNHFDLLPGGSEVTTTFNSTTSGIGGGLTGLVIHSSTTGDTFTTGGNKVVHMALELAEDTRIKGVRVCFEATNPAGTYIDQIRLAQIQDPPATALVKLDDGTPLTNPGPVCVDSAKTSINSSNGSVLLSLRVNFADVQDAIVVRALGLYVR
jgi:hypothetical protein